MAQTQVVQETPLQVLDNSIDAPANMKVSNQYVSVTATTGEGESDDYIKFIWNVQANQAASTGCMLFGAGISNDPAVNGMMFGTEDPATIASMKSAIEQSGNWVQSGFISWCFPDYTVIAGFGAAAYTQVGHLNWNWSDWQPVSATYDPASMKGSISVQRPVNSSPAIKNGEEYYMGIGVMWFDCTSYVACSPAWGMGSTIAKSKLGAMTGLAAAGAALLSMALVF